MKLLIAGGGTGGHVSPGLAVAGIWAAKNGQDSVCWAGRPGSIEEKMALSAGLSFAPLDARPLRRGLHASNLLLPWFLLKGLAQAIGIIRRERPQVLLITGGYVSVPLALAGVLMHKPLVLIEPNAVLGLANRFFSGAAEAVCCAYPMAKARRNMVLTGNPVRFKAALPQRAAALRRFGLDDSEGVLLVLPGSGAAHSINVALAEGLKGLKGLQLLWMCGPKDLEDAQKAAQGAKIRAHVAAFIEDVPSAFAAADLVLARCGASVLAEIAVAGKASILVPYPHATGNHQTLNARKFAEAGAALMLSDAELGGSRLAGEIMALFADEARLRRMSLAARGLGKADAADNVCGVLDRVAKGFKYV